MPAIIQPQPSKVGKSRAHQVQTPSDLLASASFQHRYLRVLHSSFAEPGPAASTPAAIAPFANGFVHTVLQAFQDDLHLELRPDDVWLAILTQFAFFVRRHAEQLRSVFVAHQKGQEMVLVDMRPYALENVDVDLFVERAVAAVTEKLGDPQLAAWLLPRFSTTTRTDATVAAMAFLGSMDQFFSYGMQCGCGFPSVTLHGARADWQAMRDRVGLFAQLLGGAFPDMAEWSRALDCVLAYMVSGFDTPDDERVKSFWMRAAHSAGAGASGGLVTLSGWLTTFCFWAADGTRCRSYSDEELMRERGRGPVPEEWQMLNLDGVRFPVIERKTIPAATVRVPVTVFDGHSRIKTLVVAGLVGMDVKDAAQSTVQPRPGWWLLLDK